MNKCLVTELEVVVGKDKLQPVGGIRLILDLNNYDSKSYMVFASSKTQKIYSKSNGSLLKETTVGSGNTQFRPADDGFTGKVEVIIPDKYSLTRFDILPPNVLSFDWFKYSKNMDYLNIDAKKCVTIDGNISNLYSNHMTLLNTTQHIDVADVRNVIDIECQKNYNFSGDISNCINNRLNLLRCEGTSVTGEVITFAEKRADMNRLNGLFFRGGKMTLNGKVFGSVNINVTFNSATSITITNNSDSIPTYTLTKESGTWKVTETPKES